MKASDGGISFLYQWGMMPHLAPFSSRIPSSPIMTMGTRVVGGHVEAWTRPVPVPRVHRDVSGDDRLVGKGKSSAHIYSMRQGDEVEKSSRRYSGHGQKGRRGLSVSSNSCTILVQNRLPACEKEKGLAANCCKSLFLLVPRAGLEPAQGYQP